MKSTSLQDWFLLSLNAGFFILEVANKSYALAIVSFAFAVLFAVSIYKDWY